jgi:L-arabinose isomerase
MLDASPDIPCRIVWKPVLTSREAILDLVHAANSAPNVVGLMTWMHTFSPAKMWIAGLSALDKPLLHLHTQANRELPWATIDFDFMNLNQAAHGDREFAYIETRLGVARTTVVGHCSDRAVTERVGDWCRAAAGRLAARNMSVARFGDNMRFVAVTEGDKTEAETVFGSQINTWGVMDLAALVAAATDAEVDPLIEEYFDLYDCAPTLRVDGERHDSLRYAAAIEVGLRGFLEAGGFTAFTTTFEDLGTLRQLPGLAVQRLMADGYGFGAEGDWKTAMLVRIAAVMGSGRRGGASLMEDYTYHMVPGEELSLGAHMLEVSPSLSSQRARLDIAPLSIGGKEDPVRLVFTADPGPAVLIALSDMRDRFRLVAAEVECVPLPAAIPHLPIGHAVWRSKPDFRTAATAWLAAGASHHTAMSNQITVRSVREFASMTGVELLVIDDSTTIESAEREMRLNSAVFR